MHTVRESGDHVGVRGCAWVVAGEVSGDLAPPLVRPLDLRLVLRLAPPLAPLGPGVADTLSCRTELFLRQDFHNLEAGEVAECL